MKDQSPENLASPDVSSGSTAGERTIRGRSLAGEKPLLAFLLLLVVFTWGDFTAHIFLPSLNAPHWPNPAYWVAARLALEGRADRIYASRDAFKEESLRLGTVPDIFEANTPATVLVFLPVAGLSETTAFVVWDVVMVACYVAACLMLLNAPSLPPSVALGILALAPLFQPWRENISRGQAYPLLLALLVAAMSVGFGVWKEGVDRHNGGEDVAAGLAFGLIAVVKLYYGIVLIFPAVIMRRARLLAAATGTMGLAVVVTLMLWGGDLWVKALGFSLTWQDRPESAVTAYQTVNGLLTHLLRYDAVWNRGPVADLPSLIGWLRWGIAGTLIGATLLALWRVREERPRTASRRLLAPALIVPLAPVLAPIAEDYHFVLTLFPLVVAGVVLWETYRLTWGDVTGRRRPARLLLVGGGAWLVALLLLGLPWRFNVPGVEGWSALLHYPRLYGALILWTVMIGLLLGGRESFDSVQVA